MKDLKVKHAFYAFVLFVLSLNLACGNKDKAGSTSMLYGESSKKWTTDKEKNAAGDKVDQSADDKSTSLTFFANGNYSMTSNSQTMSGKYTYDQAGKSITMTPEGAPTSMTFQVTNLDDDDMTLQAPDGSTMALEAD